MKRIEPRLIRTAESASLAHDMARRQGALSWELRTSTSLSRLQHDQGRIAEARSLLQSVYVRFSEGFETADLMTAKAYLDSWQCSIASRCGFAILLVEQKLSMRIPLRVHGMHGQPGGAQGMAGSVRLNLAILIRARSQARNPYSPAGVMDSGSPNCALGNDN
jgi:hypothetical protein